MRLAIDIDSTLHPYWDQLAEIAHRRFGIELPYETQHTWAIDAHPHTSEWLDNIGRDLEGVIIASDWAGLAERLQPVLA